MLPAAHRLTDATSYRRVLRRGRRRAARTLVVSVLVPGAEGGCAADPTRLGLVVSRAVGGSVERNRVKRRLRHLAASRLGDLPAGTEVVVRALPPACAASSAELGRDLDRCLQRCLGDARGRALA